MIKSAVPAGRISVIVPALNEAELIQTCLAALKPFSDQGHEVLVVDGGSSDGTAALAEDRATRVLACPGGRTRQQNHGAANARGDLLVFVHADTLLPYGALEALLKIAGQQRVWGRFDVRLSGAHPLFRVIEYCMNLRSRLSGIATGDQAIFVSRALFEAAGGFPDIPLMEDIALSANLKKYRPPLCSRLRVITSSRRWEQHGILITMLKMFSLRLRYALGTGPEKLAREYEG